MVSQDGVYVEYEVVATGLQAGDLISISASTRRETGRETFAEIFVSVVSGGLLSELEALGDEGLEVDSVMVSGGGAPVLLPGPYALSASTLSVMVPTDAANVPQAVRDGPTGYAGTGIFDYSVHGLQPGGIVSVVISLDEEAADSQAPYKYDDGSWSPFTTGNMAPLDNYYSASAPCPGVNARRVGGGMAGAGEWHLANDDGIRGGG